MRTILLPTADGLHERCQVVVLAGLLIGRVEVSVVAPEDPRIGVGGENGADSRWTVRETDWMDLRAAWQESADTWVRWARSRTMTSASFTCSRQVMTYHGRHRPLTAYTTALAAAGLAIETIREPLETGSGQSAMPFLHLLAARQDPVPGRGPT